MDAIIALNQNCVMKRIIRSTVMRQLPLNMLQILPFHLLKWLVSWLSSVCIHKLRILYKSTNRVDQTRFTVVSNVWGMSLLWKDYFWKREKKWMLIFYFLVYTLWVVLTLLWFYFSWFTSMLQCHSHVHFEYCNYWWYLNICMAFFKSF